MRGKLARLAGAVGVVLASSLTLGIGTAHAATSGAALAANPWIVEELGASIGSSVLSGGATSIGSTALASTAAAAAPAGAVATASSGLSATVTTGVSLAGLGGMIGLGWLPGMSFGFGSSSPALPSVNTTPAGESTAGAACPGHYKGAPSGTWTGQGRTYTFTWSSACSFGAAGTVAPNINDPYYVLGFTVSMTTGSSNGYTGIAYKMTPDNNVGANAGKCYVAVAANSSYGSGNSGVVISNSVRNRTTDTTQWANNYPSSPTYRATQWDPLPTRVDVYRIPVGDVSANGSWQNCSGFTSTGAYFQRGQTGTVDDNPLRWLESTVHCKAADGTVTTVTKSSSTFSRPAGSTATQSTPAVPEATCPPGTVMVDAGVDVVTTGSSTRVPAMQPYTANPTLVSGLTGPYASCMTTLCALHVVRLVPELDCASKSPSAGHPCRQWSQATDLATNWECRYGTYVLDMSACGALKNAYGAAATIAPNTGSTAAPAPEGTDPMEDPTPEQTPGLAESGCVPSGWNVLNPFAYAKAVGCVLKWAFVPPEGTLEADFGNVSGAWTSSPPGAYLAGFGDMAGAFGDLGTGAGGCEGPALDVLTLEDWHPLSACQAPMSTLAAVIRTGLVVVVYVGAAILAARMISAALGLQLPSFGSGD